MGQHPATAPLIHPLSDRDGYVFTGRRWTGDLGRETADRVFELHRRRFGPIPTGSVVRFRTGVAPKTVGGARRVGYNIVAGPTAVALAPRKTDVPGAARPKEGRRARARRQREDATRRAS